MEAGSNTGQGPPRAERPQPGPINGLLGSSARFQGATGTPRR
jgi:hypothetical protein